MGILSRNRPIVATAATLLVAVAIATGTYALTSSLRSGSGEVADRCFGLTDEQCNQQISQARDEFYKWYEAWLPTISTDEDYLRSLPQASMLNEPVPGKPDVPSAVGAAEIIVVGTSRSITFSPSGAVVTFGVDRFIKGSGAGQLTIGQSGGPAPAEDWSKPLLAVSDFDPILIPGDRALLFLNAADEEGTYWVQSVTGHYSIDDSGQIKALETNLFAEAVNGRTVEDFAQAIQTFSSAP